MDINKIIEDVLNNLNSISNSLEILTRENGGVVIHDTFANISSKVDFISDITTTIIGAIIGGIITIILFSVQEKSKVRQNLKLKFYEEYEPKYDEILKKISLVKNNMTYVANDIVAIGPNTRTHSYERIKTLNDVIKNFESDRIKNTISSIDELIKKFEELKMFINSKEIITGYSEFKFKKDMEMLKSIQKKFNELKSSYNMVNLFYRIQCGGGTLSHVDEYTGKTYNLTTSPQQHKEYIDKYKITYKEIVEIQEKQKLDEIENSIQEIHNKITNEFIGIYFKKWYQK